MHFVDKLKALYHEYPQQFWFLSLAEFIDSVGGALLFPFFSLYFTQKFEIGMTTVGLIYTLFAVGGLIGNALGGAMTDKIGRKRMIIFSLITSASSSLAMALVNNFSLLYPLAVIVGTLNSSGRPARQAMIADLLPPEQHASGYGISRISHNLAVVIGPMLGGFLASIAYVWLFVFDTITSLITAALVFFLLRESFIKPSQEKQARSFIDTFRGYSVVFRNRIFMLFTFTLLLLELIGFQSSSSLGVYLRDFRAIPTYQFGLLLSINAIMVVLMQFWITRRVTAHPPLVVMAVASLFYGVGFGIFALYAPYSVFILAMVIITLGEMFYVPVSQALVAYFSPEDMRGRYMAVYSMVYIIPSGLAPLLAGIFMDNGYAEGLWIGCLILGFITAAAFIGLHRFNSAHHAQSEPVPVVQG